jgi:hypothetical protein
VAQRYLLTIDTDFDPPEVSVEVFTDFAAHERAKREHERNMRRIAKAAADFNVKQLAEKATEIEREKQEHIDELNRLTLSAECQLLAIEKLPGCGSMFEYAQAQGMYHACDRELKAATAHAATHGLRASDRLLDLRARLTACKAKVGA